MAKKKHSSSTGREAAPRTGETARHDISRRHFLRQTTGCLAGGLAATTLGTELGRKTAMPTEGGVSPRNVVLILADDQGNHLSCLNTPGIRTPRLDALAQRGTLFTRIFATAASCSPCRSAILTGMYPHANGHWRNTVTPHLGEPDKQFGRQSTKLDKVGVHEDIPTLIELLRQAGWLTGITEKFHLSPPWKFPFERRLPVGAVPEQIAAAVKGFAAAAGPRRFFLQANLGATHRPFRPRLERAAQNLPELDAIAVPPQYPDTELMRRDLQQYYAAVELVDRCAGAVLDGLRGAGCLDDTLILFTSDQGFPYHRAKASAYEAGVRVPLIAAGPGVTAGKRCGELISHTDLMPTVLETAGLAIPKSVQGRSLWPLLRGAAALPGRDVVFAEHNSHGPNPRELYPSRAVTDGRFYYILNLMPERDYALPADLVDAKKPWENRSYEATVAAKDTFPIQYDLLQTLMHGRPAEELYDLHTDPGQIHNLAGDPRFGPVRQRLRAALDQWRRETGDCARNPQTIQRRREPAARPDH